MGEGNEKLAKGSYGLKRAEEDNHTETSKESRNKSWSSNAQNIK